MSYGAACCPQTQEILNRFVQIRLGPRYTSRIDAYLIENIRAVYREQMS